MTFEKVRTMLRRAVSPASDPRQAAPPPTPTDAGLAACEINRSLDAVLGNVALILTQLDPASDAHARARRTLSETRRIRDLVSHLAEAEIRSRIRNAA